MLRKHTGWFDESCVLQEAGWTVHSRPEIAGFESSSTVMSSELDTTSFFDSEEEDSASRWVFKAFLLLFETDVWWTISNQDHKTNSNSDYDDILLTRLPRFRLI